MLRKVKLDDAIGLVLGHDVTKVIPGKFKGPAFRRGHVITKGDIQELQSIGKEHVYVIELDEGEVHEEEAALRIAQAVSGPGLEFSQPKEGRINLRTKYPGLLRVNTVALRQINSIGEIVLATRHDHTYCQAGSIVAGTKIVPLFIAKEELEKLEDICNGAGPVIDVIPLQKRTIGLVITGNEISSGRTRDGFGDFIRSKAANWGSTVGHQVIVPDDEAVIAKAIHEVKARNSDVIIVCGGLSVDPDDATVDGVKKSGAMIISYGAPVMPGVMFLLADLDGIPVLGAPSAVIYNPATILDLILPRVLAGEKVSREDIIELGHGGLCLNCETCSFPVCPFGK
jgi:hypothetical protein